MKRTRIRLFNQTRSEHHDDAERATVVKDRTQLFNQLTLLLLALTPIVFLCYLVIFLFPDSGLNPLRPEVVQQVITLAPTPTPTPQP